MVAPSTSPPSPPWPFQRPFRVAYHDVDALHHLNHAAYFVYMETLRCEYYLALTGSLDPHSLDIILAEASCRYLAPVPFATDLIGEIAPARPLGQSSFALLYRFRTPQGQVTALGRTVQVSYDYAQGRKRPIPPERRALLERDALDPASAGFG